MPAVWLVPALFADFRRRDPAEPRCMHWCDRI